MRGCLFFLHHPNLRSRYTYQVSPHCGSSQRAGFQVWRCSAARSLNCCDFELRISGKDPDLTAFSVNRWSTDPLLMKSISCSQFGEGGKTQRERVRERETEEPQSAVSVIQPLSQSIHTSTHHLTFFQFQVLRVSGACSLMLFRVAW